MIAQTNLQLFAQLHTAGATPEQMAPVREAYRLAIELFAARFRGNGRPFVCHLVGSASIGADLGLSLRQVAACLLHAAYEQGAFPSGRAGAAEINRRHVRSRVGPEIEALAFAYQTQPWSDAAIDALVEAESLPPATLVVAQMRLADLLDDLQDAGCVSTPTKFDSPARQRIGKAIALAGRIGMPHLADRLRAAEMENANAAWAVDAVEGQAQSFTLKSFSLKPTLLSLLRARLAKGHGH